MFDEETIASAPVAAQAVEHEASCILPVATVVEDLGHDGVGFCAKVRWLFNPVPVGQELLWNHNSGLRVKLANPSMWRGFGCDDVGAVFTVFDSQRNDRFGSGTGLRVRPAIQPNHSECEMVWYDSAHFTPVAEVPPSDKATPNISSKAAHASDN
jgi:hypothetical protein